MLFKFSKFLNINSFEVIETFYIILCRIFNKYSFPRVTLLLAFIDTYLRSSFRDSFYSDKTGYPLWDKPDIRKQYLKTK